MLFDSGKIFFYCVSGFLNPPETARDKDFKALWGKISFRAFRVCCLKPLTGKGFRLMFSNPYGERV